MWYKVKHLTFKNKLQCKLVYYYHRESESELPVLEVRSFYRIFA